MGMLIFFCLILCFPLSAWERQCLRPVLETVTGPFHTHPTWETGPQMEQHSSGCLCSWTPVCACLRDLSPLDKFLNGSGIAESDDVTFLVTTWGTGHSLWWKGPSWSLLPEIPPLTIYSIQSALRWHLQPLLRKKKMHPKAATLGWLGSSFCLLSERKDLGLERREQHFASMSYVFYHCCFLGSLSSFRTWWSTFLF